MGNHDNQRAHHDLCPEKCAGVLDNWLRRLLQNPDKILAGLIQPGQTVLDVGCGPGMFTMAMARMVGENGKVIAADLQQGMLDRVRKHAVSEGLESRVELHKTESDSIGLDERVDFVLAFYMVHEVPDQEKFLREISELLKPGGTFLLVEPKVHVPGRAFEKTVEIAKGLGFEVASQRKVILSRAVVLRRT